MSGMAANYRISICAKHCAYTELTNIETMKARAKRKDNGEWIEGFYWSYLDPHSTEDKYIGSYIHNGCNISKLVEVDPTTIEYEVNGEWYNYEEIFEAVPKGMALKFTRNFRSMSQEERDNFWAEIKKEPEEDDESMKMSELLALWNREVSSENARLRAEVERLEAELTELKSLCIAVVMGYDNYEDEDNTYTK